MIKCYYGPGISIDESCRIIPAPLLTINTKLDYANDVITGYSFVISINGTASTLQQKYNESLANGEEYHATDTDPIATENNLALIQETESILYTPNHDENFGIQSLLAEIDKLQQLFSRNGSDLVCRDDQNNDLLRAKGGIIKSINFDRSSNNWTRTCPYSIEIEFNELEILDETIFAGKNSPIDSHSQTKLVDFVKHKIKNFSDSWSINVDDNLNSYTMNPSFFLQPITTTSDTPSYNQIFGRDENGALVFATGLSIFGTQLSISYSLSATGKHYYSEDKLIPAWVQAKNFCQDRLQKQVLRVLSGALSMSQDNLGPTLENLHDVKPSGSFQGLNDRGFSSIDPDPLYGIYNETLSCTCSESQGTYSIEYNAILKRQFDGPFDAPNVKHTVNKSKNVSRNGTKNTVSISIDGEIEGLCEGGILTAGQQAGFIMPTGTWATKIIKAGATQDKYTNAKNFLSKITNPDRTDLAIRFKEALFIIPDELSINTSGCGIQTPATGVKPSSFNLTHNHMNGTISYNVEYSTDRNCGKNDGDGYSLYSTTVSVEEPNPIIAEFTVPNGDYVIQDIGTVTSRKISVSSQGRRKDFDCCDMSIVNSGIEDLFPFLELPDETQTVITNKSLSYNLYDGSFTLNLGFICNSGCTI